MIKAVIFDMDGILIDSEPLWRKAEIAAFEAIGIHITEAMCELTMGYRTDEVAQYWHDQFKWESPSVNDVANDIVERVGALIESEGQAMAGIVDLLETLSKQDLKLALASSSYMVLIDKVVDKLEIRKYFEQICSAEHEEYGKPHPAIFINTAKKLGVNPWDCLVIEDSSHGVIAGKAAKMTVVAIPAIHHRELPEIKVAQHVLNSAVDFKIEFIQ